MVVSMDFLTVERAWLIVPVWLKDVSFPSASCATPNCSIPSLTVTASTLTEMPPAPMPTPATVASISRWVLVLIVRSSFAVSILLSRIVLTLSLKVLTSTPTPMPANNAPAPVPVASVTFSRLVVSMAMVSASRSLSLIRLITSVLIWFTTILLPTAPLNKAADTPTEVSVASSLLLLDAPTDNLDFAAAPCVFGVTLISLCSTSAKMTE